MEEEVRKYTGICSSVQKKYREDIPETKEMDYLHRVNGKRRGNGKKRGNGIVGMRRVDASLSLSFLYNSDS